MSRPPINPEKTTAGIAVDPQTLERVVPESKRPDGSVRKQLKIRPGFTPQEDVRRFRGTRQAQMDTNTLPKGHIIGWAPPPQSTAATSESAKPMSKSAKKNAKRKEKRQETKKEEVPENWEDDDDDDGGDNAKSTKADELQLEKSKVVSTGERTDPKSISTSPASASSPHDGSSNIKELTSQIDKLKVK